MSSPPSAFKAPQSPRSLQERAADVITGFCGDMRFVYVHAVAFAVWIATKGFGNDTFPFNFLTMVVSLEAIFLSTFILISQNRQQVLDEANNDLVQARLLKMLGQVIDDERLDLLNEKMISELLTRLDVERISPIDENIKALRECVARIETSLIASS